MLAYAILSNHYHLVLRNRPDQVQPLSDREVVTNWLMICPKSQKPSDDRFLVEEALRTATTRGAIH